jgi:hypothetical protein
MKTNVGLQLGNCPIFLGKTGNMVQKVARHVAIKVADETWIATALLHREHPARSDFTVSEIVERARSENIAGELRPGVSVHAYLHCVANLAPNDATYRMLFETAGRKRRLFRSDDEAHPARKGKITPRAEEIPVRYRHLLNWYHDEYDTAHSSAWLRGIYEMIGAGKEIFAGEDPDAYVRRLREDWK